MRGLEAAGHAGALSGYDRDGTGNCFSHLRRGHRQQRRLRAGYEAAGTVPKCTALRSFWSEDFGGKPIAPCEYSEVDDDCRLWQYFRIPNRGGFAFFNLRRGLPQQATKAGS